ncbi:MAG TPA: hypothetical protein VIH75_18650 [Candidatus Sulfotelmatobacter sp.]|jgi:hypothetical protein
MTPSTSLQDLSAQWKSACRLYPIYFELAREFAVDVKASVELETGGETPGKETVEQAQLWLEEMDRLIQVHQLRQFLQTSSLVNQEGLLNLLEHFLGLTAKTEATRDKIDFLLVQYFSQLAPSGVRDAEVDLAYVAQTLEPILGEIELTPPIWLNALDRVLEAAGHCRSLDELLHGGVLEQGRKAKGLAGDLFYLPISLVAFTRFGYLMRRSFFRLMLGDLNLILDGLTELEDKGVVTIDCRRAQFSAQEPIVRLRMICQSWKVMFQAEYSSGQPLRMLVDLRAAVDQALGRGQGSEAEAPAESKPASVVAKPIASAAAATAGASKPSGKVAVAPACAETPETQPSLASSDSAEFEVSRAPDWDPDSESEAGNKS